MRKASPRKSSFSSLPPLNPTLREPCRPKEITFKLFTKGNVRNTLFDILLSKYLIYNAIHWLKCNNLTCWGGWCPTCRICRQPQGQVAGHQVSPWVETFPLSPSLPPAATDSQPWAQGSEHSLFENHPEQYQEEGSGEGKEEVVELSGLWSRLKILPGDVRGQPDGRRPEGGRDGCHCIIPTGRSLNMMKRMWAFATLERKLDITWIEIEDALCVILCCHTWSPVNEWELLLPYLLSVNL